jgi:Nuclease A inhibitor-like protein
MTDALLTTLTQATAGLLYPSEYDAPLEPFVWEPANNTLTEVRRLSGHPPKSAARPSRPTPSSANWQRWRGSPRWTRPFKRP